MTTGTAAHGTGVYIIQEERRKRERERGTGYNGREERKEERMSELVECGRKRRKGLPLPWWRKG